MKEIVRQLKRAKSFSVILNCTPDNSHTDGMTVA